MKMALVSIEGVLAPSKGSVPAHASIKEGVALCTALSTEYELVLTCRGGYVESDAFVELQRWVKSTLLDVNNVRTILPCPDWWDYAEWKADRVRGLRAAGWDVQLFVDGDPEAIAGALRESVTVLFFAQPAYVRPEWRPDAERQSAAWGVLVSEIEAQQNARVADIRATGEDVTRG